MILNIQCWSLSFAAPYVVASFPTEIRIAWYWLYILKGFIDLTVVWVIGTVVGGYRRELCDPEGVF